MINENPDRRFQRDWDGVERRADQHNILFDLVADMNEKITRLTDDLREHAEREEKLFERVMNGFPEQDPEGHRRAHELRIEKEQARVVFWRKLTFEITKYGLLGVIGWLVMVMWKAFLLGPGK